MDFLGIGPIELLVVLIIALIVVGPERLPHIAQSVGKTMRDLRAMSQGLTAELQQELAQIPSIEAGEQKLQKALTKPLKEAQAEIQQSLNVPPLSSPSEATTEAAPPKTPPAPATPTIPNDDA